MQVPGFVITSLSTSKAKDGGDFTPLLNISGEFQSPNDADLSAIFQALKLKVRLTLQTIEAPIHLSKF